MVNTENNERKLFGANITPACEYCANSHNLNGDDTCFCELNANYVEVYDSCESYVYDPLRRVPRRRMPMPEFSADDFKL